MYLNKYPLTERIGSNKNYNQNFNSKNFYEKFQFKKQYI